MEPIERGVHLTIYIVMAPRVDLEFWKGLGIGVQLVSSKMQRIHTHMYTLLFMECAGLTKKRG